MRTLFLSCLLVLLATTQQVSATLLNNGSFDDCSYSGWSKDTDGFGDISTMNDFTLTGAPDCAAQLLVDGSNTDAFFANTLFQDMNLTSGVNYSLSFDLFVDSEITSADGNFLADYFFVGFGDGSGDYFGADGQLGSVLDGDIDGTANYSFDVLLSDTLTAMSDLTLEFQLLIGFDDVGSDIGASLMTVDNVAITAVQDNTITASAPSTLALFSLCLVGLMLTGRKRGIGEQS